MSKTNNIFKVLKNKHTSHFHQSQVTVRVLGGHSCILVLQEGPDKTGTMSKNKLST